MHNVELVEDGRISGWLAGRDDGCPSSVSLSSHGRQVNMPATINRPDVLDAGFTLFSGFTIRVSAHSDEECCEVKVEDKIYNVMPTKKPMNEILFVDEQGTNFLSGWFKNRESLRSLCFYTGAGMIRAEIHKRSDVNRHLETPSDRLHGYRVEDVDVNDIYAVTFNNELVHWIEPGAFS